MAQCETGYLCEVCGGDVEAITESDLYLRYVLGELPIFVLHQQRERHIRCNPASLSTLLIRRSSLCVAKGRFRRARWMANS